MKKNLIILNNLVRFNAIKLYPDNIVRVPDYIVNYCIENDKKLVIVHKDKVVSELTGDDIFLNIRSIDGREYKGTFFKDEITYKLALYKIDESKI